MNFTNLPTYSYISTYDTTYNWPGHSSEAILASPLALADNVPQGTNNITAADPSSTDNNSVQDQPSRYHDKQLAREVRSFYFKFPHLLTDEHSDEADRESMRSRLRRLDNTVGHVDYVPTIHGRNMLLNHASPQFLCPTRRGSTDTFHRLGCNRDYHERTGSTVYRDVHVKSALALLSNNKYVKPPLYGRNNPQRFSK